MKFLCYYKILPGRGEETRAQWTGSEEKWFGTTMQWDKNIVVDIHPCSEDDGALAAIQKA